MLVQTYGKCCSQLYHLGLLSGTSRGAYQGYSLHHHHQHSPNNKPSWCDQHCTDLTPPATRAFAGIAQQARISSRDVLAPLCRGAEATKLEQFPSSSLVHLNCLTKLILVLPRSADIGCHSLFPCHMHTSTLMNLKAKSTSFSPRPP